MPAKKTLSDVVAATSDGLNMKLRSPSTRRSTKIHTPEPALKKKDQPAEPPKKDQPAKPPKNKAGTLIEGKKKTVMVEGNITDLTIPNIDDVVPDPVSSPKKRTVSVQTLLRRSPRCSTKLTVEKPSKKNPKKTLLYPVTESETETDVPMLVDPPAASKYPTRTVSSSHQRVNRYPSLTPSPTFSENPPVQTHSNPSNEEPPANPPNELVLNESPNEEQPAKPSNEDLPANPSQVPNDAEYSDDNTQEMEELHLSIRVNMKDDSTDDENAHVDVTETSKKRKRRGVVCGSKIATLVNSLGTKIKVECSKEANGPVIRQIRSMMCHQIGACVRQKVPMLAPTYSELERKHWDVVVNYLSPHFFLPKNDALLWEYIIRIANNRYKNWKSSCHKHYLKNGKKLPLEFVHRKEEWAWLVNHFQDPVFEAKSKRMKEAREKKKNHCGGKTPMAIRAIDHLQKGHKANHVATYADVYSREPECAEIVEHMNAEVQRLLDDQQSDDPSSIADPIPTSTQLEIISKAVGQKKGTQISGVGGNIRRPPRPRGGASNHALKEEIIRAKEEAAMKEAEFEDRLRAVEEMLSSKTGGGGGTGNGGNVSDGASFGLGTL